MSFSALYAKTSVVPRKDAINFLNRYGPLLKWQNYKENILDVGCGDGSVTKEILYPYVKDHVERLVAVDLSKEMIEFAKTNNDIKAIRFSVADLSTDNDMNKMGIRFDHIFSFYCVHWILDQRSLIQRFYNILNPGGQIFITILVDSTIHKTFNKHVSERTWSKYLPNTSGFADYSEKPEEYLQNLLEETGFEVVLTKAEKKIGTFDDFKGFIRSIASVHRFIEYIPEELQEQYIQDHVKSSCEFSIQVDNSDKYNWPYESLIFIATKK